MAINRYINQFPVIIREDESGGYWVQCPTLEGCYSQGETIDEALANIREAIDLCLADIPARERARGQAISQFASCSRII